MAIKQHYIDLISADIDGEISDSEKAELSAFLLESAEGRALHGEMTALCEALDAVEDLDPPRHIRHVIMNSVSTPATQPASPGLLQSILAAPALRYAATFAAGVFLALALVESDQISNRAFDDVAGLVGSVADPVGADFVTRVSVDKAEVAGTVSLRSAGSILILDFDLVAPAPIEIEAGYSDSSIWFNGFAQLESTGTSVSAETGRITLGMEGKRRYAVFLQNKGGRGMTLNLQFRADGKIVHETSLSYAAPD